MCCSSHLCRTITIVRTAEQPRLVLPAAFFCFAPIFPFLIIALKSNLSYFLWISFEWRTRGVAAMGHRLTACAMRLFAIRAVAMYVRRSMYSRHARQRHYVVEYSFPNAHLLIFHVGLVSPRLNVFRAAFSTLKIDSSIVCSSLAVVYANVCSAPCIACRPHVSGCSAARTAHCFCLYVVCPCVRASFCRIVFVSGFCRNFGVRDCYALPSFVNDRFACRLAL